jgi:hypothetical protein
MLVLEDAGGEALDRFLGQPMELSRFLRFGVCLAAALGKLTSEVSSTRISSQPTFW